MYKQGTHGLIFTLNSQTQAKYSSYFFNRAEVGMRMLADSLLVEIDCSQLSPLARDDLFMASRDRIANNEFSRILLQEISRMLHEHRRLKDLKYRRMNEIASSEKQPSDIAEDIIRELAKSNKGLLKYLLEGGKIRVPSPPTLRKPFEGKRHPKKWEHKDKHGCFHVTKRAQVGKNVTVIFETDVENHYFAREHDVGCWDVRLVDCEINRLSLASEEGMLETSRLELNDGIARLVLRLENPEVGDKYTYEMIVDDNVISSPLIRQFTLQFVKQSGPNGSPNPRPSINWDLPTMHGITKEDWGAFPGFTENTAVQIYPESKDTKGRPIYKWIWNKDNKHLTLRRQEAARDKSHESPTVVDTVFCQAMLLTGLSALRTQEELAMETAKKSDEGHKDKYAQDDKIPSPEDLVAYTTAALAPVAWSLITQLAQSIKGVAGDGTSH